MFINIEELLTERNKTKYWLAKATGLNYTTIFKLAKNKTNSIQFYVIEEICTVLECTPNDLFKIAPPPNHHRSKE